MTDVRARLESMMPEDEELEGAQGRARRMLEERVRLVEASRALLDQRPSDEALRRVLKDEGRVPITKATVEVEAGVDRRRFSGKGSEHPDLSALLKELKPDHGLGATATERLQKQARRIAVLEQQLTAARSATAAQVARIDALKVKLRSAERRLERVRAGSDEGEED